MSGTTAPAVDRPADGAAAPPVIEMRGAGLTYPGPPAVSALKPCELTVRKGEFVTIVGPSGSGKSTFLNIAGLLDSPTEGQYLLDGIDTGALGDADRSALRGRRIGFVFQAFHLLPHRTAVENVTLSMVYGGTPARTGSPPLGTPSSASASGTAWRRSRRPCRAANGSAWRSRGPWPRAPLCCSATSPRATWTPRRPPP